MTDFVPVPIERRREPEMRQGHMYQVIGGFLTEVVRHDGKLVPITDPIVKEIPGQLVLELEYPDVED